MTREAGPDALTRACEAAPPFALALDFGTSSVRASLFDSRGRELNETRARIERDFRTGREGGAEMDADAAFVEAVSVIDATISRAPREILTRIEAFAFACFWHSLVGVDAEGRAATPVYLWADTRAASESARLKKYFDEREAHARTGCRFHPSYWPAKLLWIKNENSLAWRNVARWLSFGEYVCLRLCDDATASVSMASGTGLFNQALCAWDDALIEGLGLRIERLPALARDGQTFSLNDEYSSRWPALRGAKVFPAVGDGAANSIGAGCSTAESVALMIGTSGAMRVVSEGEPGLSPDASLWRYRVDRRRTVTGGALSDGGGLYEWMKASLRLDVPNVSLSNARDEDSNVSDESLEDALAALAPDAHGLTVLPFWAGERSVGWRESAQGAILGLNMHTRPVEVVRAALESVAYRFALIAEALLPHASKDAEIRATGGALVASRLWAQIIADALARPLRLSQVSEATSRGAVLLALEALGGIKDVSDPPAPRGEEIEPDMSRHAAYRRGLQRQRKFYDLLANADS